MIRSSNPALSSNVFREARGMALQRGDRMTIQGTVNKSALLLLIFLIPALYTWSLATSQGSSQASFLMMVGFIGGFIAALFTIFKKSWSPVTAPIYAAFEGLALGGISGFFENTYQGIVFQAVGLTAMVFFGLLLAYQTKIIQATEKFKLGVAAATMGIFFFYIMQLIISLFGVPMTFLHDSSPLSIGISLVIVIVAALNLIMDFDFIEDGERTGAPKFMEWYAAFGLMVTLVWLYLEILRLLAKLKDR